MFSDEKYVLKGRLKELIITSGGENIAPVPVEARMKNSLPGLLSNCMVVGDRRKFLSILLTLKVDLDPVTMMPTNKLTPELRKYLEQECGGGIAMETVDDYLKGPAEVKRAVDAIIENALKKVNEGALSRAQTLQYFLVLPRDFSIGGGELTPTMKVKRSVIEKMYKKELDKLYAEAEASGPPAE